MQRSILHRSHRMRLARHHSYVSAPARDSSMHLPLSLGRGVVYGDRQIRMRRVEGCVQMIQCALHMRTAHPCALLCLIRGQAKCRNTVPRTGAAPSSGWGCVMNNTVCLLRTNEMDEEWPAELLSVSDARHCMLTMDWDARSAHDTANVHSRLMFSAPRARGGNDAGIVAHAPPAAPPGCWPASVSRSPVPASLDAPGFYVATCAPTNANEVRQLSTSVHGSVRGGVIGAVCSRSHQTFMNTTRKCTGTYNPSARHRPCNGEPLQPAT
jgi:hypothetical protein